MSALYLPKQEEQAFSKEVTHFIQDPQDPPASAAALTLWLPLSLEVHSGIIVPARLFCIVFFFFNIYLFIWLCQVLVAAHRIFDLPCSIRVI